MSKSLTCFVGLMLLAIVTAGSDAAAQQLVRVGYSGTGVAKNLHKIIEWAGL